MSAFPCTGCGLCCRQVGRALTRYEANPELFGSEEREALAAFPYRAGPDGACEQLAPDGRCGVYEDRPLICRVDAMGMARGWSRDVTWALAAAACDALQNEAGVPADSPWRVARDAG